jgi:hypothetical protein
MLEKTRQLPEPLSFLMKKSKSLRSAELLSGLLRPKVQGRSNSRFGDLFIFLKGKGKFIVGGEETEFSAPCTVIAPANVPHAYVNTGEEPTDAIVIIEIDSKIYDADNNVMDFPWRK